LDDEEEHVENMAASKGKAAEQDEDQERHAEIPALRQLLQPLSEDDLSAIQNAWDFPEHSVETVLSLDSGAGGSLVHILGEHMRW
jgi:hypothetical protein